jgi:hypothetical protein
MEPHARRTTLVARGTIALFAIAAVAAVGAVSAGGAGADRYSYRFAFVVCSGSTADGGPVSLTVSTTGNESIADVFRWNRGSMPSSDPPAVANRPEDPITLSWIGNTMAGSATVYRTADGVRIGDVSWSLTLVPGAPTPFENRARNGNHLTREQGSTYALAASGTLAFPGGEVVSLVRCDGSGGDNAVFQNRPRSDIAVSDVSQAFCEVRGADDRLLIAVVDGPSVSLREYAAAADPDADVPLVFGSTEDALFTRRTLSATVPIFAPAADDSPLPAGEATLSAAVTPGVPTTTLRRADRTLMRVRVWPLRLSGAATLAGGGHYDLAGCTGARFLVQLKILP